MAADLAANGDKALAVADFDFGAAKRAAEGLGEAFQVDVRDSAALDALADQCEVMLGCVPYRLQPHVADSAFRSGVHYLDLGCDTPDTHRILARDAERAMIPDCGLAPGLANALAAEAVRRTPGADWVKLYCGVLPQDRERPLGYKISFALDGLVGEYEDLAYVLREGKPQEIESLTEFESLWVEGVGELEAFVTSGGSGTSPDLYEGKLRSYEYKTLRYPGHGTAMRMFRDLGFWSEDPVLGVKPKEMFMRVLERRLTDPAALELAILRVETAAWRADVVHRQSSEDAFSSMESLTAWGITIPALAVARGDVLPGARRLEQAVPWTAIESGLAMRGVAVRWESLS